MMQVVRKWKVSVNFVGPTRPVELWISDNFLGNVLRQIASMDFSENGLEQPASILISEARPANVQSGITTNVAQGGVRVDPVVRTEHFTSNTR